ncbi:hypothetical protein FV242_05730 [Methylobacterium sp. WL64]|uniref:hypothetical protein n=1 Tax=Methylobacterium sp. WL64 TaxID=2603894 RepID=UPI0011C83E6B|nr:hypothetical protein [Methylobacterium sp. WL64]TXN04854.1 hypothetical protein FV242_05730 [Methylobacterium sp. WL64]
MANVIEVQRDGRALHAIPRPARHQFRRRVAEARFGCDETRAAFAAVGVDDVLRHTLDLFDLVAAGLASLDEEDRAAAELTLFGQPLPIGPAALIQEVLARGRADNLDDRQMAGGIQVVLESHGYLPRAA